MKCITYSLILEDTVSSESRKDFREVFTRGGFSETLWTLTGRIFAVLAVNGVIRNLVDGCNSIVDNIVRTKDIQVKIPIRPLHGFLLKVVTAEPRPECIVNPDHWIEIHRRGYTVYEFVSLATKHKFSLSLLIYYMIKKVCIALTNVTQY